ncbi:uncharacterized protein TNCV_4560461 [Trichonephila clavipes]|nr:uncharacterized protein TNCV_4560461 [Trichonephila clavipes]
MFGVREDCSKSCESAMSSLHKKETIAVKSLRVAALHVAFLGFWTVKTVLNPISGQFFDEGHGESGVLRSAEWHDDDWLDDGIREAWLLCFVRMVDFQKFLPWPRAK